MSDKPKPEPSAGCALAPGSEDLRSRLRWWLAGYARAIYEARDLKRQAKAAIRGAIAVARSQSAFPPNDPAERIGANTPK